MKKIFLFLFTAAFALTLGVAFAYESMPITEPMGPVLSNGITHFDLGPATDCSAEVSGVSGSAAGGERSDVIAKNGVTYFDLGSESTAKGICANPALDEGAKIENGITKF